MTRSAKHNYRIPSYADQFSSGIESPEESENLRFSAGSHGLAGRVSLRNSHDLPRGAIPVRRSWLGA